MFVKKIDRTIKFSVVIPAFNEEQNIQVCLEAIISQSYPAFEIIVVDNNSTDNTAKIANNFEGVTVIKEKQQGIAHARNAGFNKARGNIIARIDADSIVPSDWLVKMAKTYNDNSEIVGVSGPACFYDHALNNLASRFHTFYAIHGTRLIINNFLLWGSNMSFKANIWTKIKHEVNNNNDIWEDVDLSTRVGKYGKIKFIEHNAVKTSARSANMGMIGLAKYFWRWPKTYEQFGFKPFVVSLILFLSLFPFWVPGAILGFLTKQKIGTKIRNKLIILRV